MTFSEQTPAEHETSPTPFLERLAAWSGLAFLLIFGLGWVTLARFLPPISPDLSAGELAAFINDRRLAILSAAVVVMVSTIVMLPFSALLVQMIRRIEGRAGMLTLMVGFTLTTNLVSNFFFGLFLSAAAFRPDRSPEATLLASDLAFLLFMGGIALFFSVWFITAYAVLIASPREDPILPRWWGYLNLWAGLLFVPELLIYYFKTGPFAWNGAVGFWIPAIVFTIYFLSTAVVFPRAVRRLQ